MFDQKIKHIVCTGMTRVFNDRQIINMSQMLLGFMILQLLSNPISFRISDSANIDTFVVVLETGCAAGRNARTGIGGTVIRGGAMTMDEIG